MYGATSLRGKRYRQAAGRQLRRVPLALLEGTFCMAEETLPEWLDEILELTATTWRDLRYRLSVPRAPVAIRRRPDQKTGSVAPASGLPVESMAVFLRSARLIPRRR